MSPPKKKIDRDSFFLCRIIGNDLVPRHQPGQARENLQFILENEPALKGCQKSWIVNRIVDDAERSAIIRMLDDWKQDYTVIPFDLPAYRKIGLDTARAPAGFERPEAQLHIEPRKRLSILAAMRTSKINAAIGINAARNRALSYGRGKAHWILPWDGGCFLTSPGWEEIFETVQNRNRLSYFLVPTARIETNAALLADACVPPANDEPQIVFRHDAREKFDERYPYGHLDKVELLLRLDAPGKWKDWPRASWDLPRPKPCADAGKFVTTGWVARLSSGRTAQDVGQASTVLRVEARAQAIVDFIERLDGRKEN
jgi:hypothetical protein